MRRLPMTLALLAAVALAGGCKCDDDEDVTLCETDEDCTEASTPYCDTESNECVECLEADHCGTDESCIDFACVPDETGCTSDDDCTEAGAEYCDVDSGECVECVEDDHCSEGYTCTSAFACEVQCDFEGFEPVSTETIGGDDPQYGKYVIYVGEDAGGDAIVLELFDGASFEPGVTQIGDGPGEDNYATCQTCVLLAGNCGAEGDCDFFFAIGGELHVDEIGIDDGDLFAGSLENVVLQEVGINWQTYESTPVPGGAMWCLDNMPFSGYVNAECIGHDDCDEPTPHCNLDNYTCVECLEDDHCEGDTCIGNRCIDLDDCDFSGFEPVSAETVGGDDPEHGKYLVYQGEDVGGDVIVLEMWGGASFEPGVTQIGDGPGEDNYATCQTCVLVAGNCDEEGYCDLFLAIGGELHVDEIGIDDGDLFAGSLENVALQEVEIDGWTYESTPVPDGALWCIDYMSFSDHVNAECIEHADCDEPTPHCDLDSYACVECLEQAHCPAGQVCEDGLCLLYCDEGGFTAAFEAGLYFIDAEADEFLRYVGSSAEEHPLDELSITWALGDGSIYMGAGIYEIDAGSTPEDCELCVEIAQLDGDGEVERLFFAIDGVVDISAVGGHEEPFEGLLRDAVLVEWDMDTGAIADDPLVWCLSLHEWATELDGDLPAFQCEGDHHCTLPGLGYCDTGAGACVGCVLDEHCHELADCVDGACVYSCDEMGFAMDVDESAYTSAHGGVLTYVAGTSDELPKDELQVVWWEGYGAPFTGVGRYPVEEDTAWGSCGLCLRIVQLDADENTIGYYFAVSGEVEITALDYDADSFRGVLHDVVLVEWDGDTNEAVENGDAWCIDGYTWDTPIPVNLPPPSCLTDANCQYESLPICEPDRGVCVECLSEEDCEGEEVCLSNICLILPDGNVCPDAFEITSSGTHTGSMLGYTNNFSPGSGDDTCTGYSANGPDVVFQLTLAPDQTIEVVYTLMNADGSLYIVSECIDGEEYPVNHYDVCLVGVDETLSNAPEEVSYTNTGTEEQTVYVILDSYMPPTAPAAATWEAVFTLTP